VQSKDWDVVLLQLSSVKLWINFWNEAKQRLRCGYNAAYFCLHWAYSIELVQSGDWDAVILQLYSVYIVHSVLNWCKAETEMWLYCSSLRFILWILYWTGAKKRLRCGYTAAIFSLYCAYSIELVQSRVWDVVILKLPSVYIVFTVLNWCKAETEMRLYRIYFLFIMCILFWTGANQWLRCGYSAANFSLYLAYCIELVLSRDLDVVILKQFSVYSVNFVLNLCKAKTELW